MRECDIFILSNTTPVLIPFLLAFSGKTVVMDYYGPDFLEFYEISKYEGRIVNGFRHLMLRKKVSLLLALSDILVTSSDSLIKFFQGIAFENGLLSMSEYRKDKPFSRRFLAIPYGFEPIPFTDAPAVGKKYFPDIDFSNPVFVWGGGVWNWFDSSLVVKSASLLKSSGTQFKILFPAIKVNPIRFTKLSESDELVKDVQGQGLSDEIVFGDSWLPRGDCINVFSLCRAGLSIAMDSIENRFAFRTRIIDYMAAGLPIIATQGDVLSEVIEKEQLGITVPTGDEKALALAMQKFVLDSEFHNTCKRNVLRVRDRFTWKEALRPLSIVLSSAKSNKSKKPPLKLLFLLLAYIPARWLFWLSDVKHLIGRAKLFLGAR